MHDLNRDVNRLDLLPHGRLSNLLGHRLGDPDHLIPPFIDGDILAGRHGDILNDLLPLNFRLDHITIGGDLLRTKLSRDDRSGLRDGTVGRGDRDGCCASTALTVRNGWDDARQTRQRQAIEKSTVHGNMLLAFSKVGLTNRHSGPAGTDGLLQTTVPLIVIGEQSQHTEVVTGKLWLFIPDCRHFCGFRVHVGALQNEFRQIPPCLIARNAERRAQIRNCTDEEANSETGR